MTKKIPEWIETWVTPPERYEEYLEVYKRYQRAESDIEKVTNEINNVEFIKEQLKNSTGRLLDQARSRDEFKKNTSQGNNIEEQIGLIRKTLPGYIEAFESKESYESARDDITMEYAYKKEAYFNKRRNKLENDLSEILDEKKDFHQDSNAYVKKIVEKSFSGIGTVIEGKQKELDNFMNSEKQFRRSKVIADIKDVIANEKPKKDFLGRSEENLVLRITNLMNGNNFVKKEKRKVTADDIHNNRTTGSCISVLILFSIAYLFMCAYFNPMEGFLPGSAIAATTSSAVFFVKRVFVSLLFGIFIYAVFAVGLDYVISDTGLLVAAIPGIYAVVQVYKTFDGDGDGVRFLGAGNAVHGIIVWILQGIVLIILLYLLTGIIQATPLNRLFYKLKGDIVAENLEQFQKYFYSNKNDFLALFNFELAMSMVCENRISYEESSVKNSIDNIKHEDGYTKIGKLEADKKKGFDNAYKEFLSQEKDLRNKFYDMDKDRIEKMNEEMETKNNIVKAGLQEIYSFVSKITKSENIPMHFIKTENCYPIINEFCEEEKSVIDKTLKEKQGKLEKMKDNVKGDEAFLIKRSDSFLKNTEDFNLFMNDSADDIVDSTKTVYKMNASISQALYFIDHKRDSNNMVGIHKIPWSCSPTIIYYNPEELVGDNLSDEFLNCIQWLCESIRRTVPKSIIEKIKLIDLSSGNSVLKVKYSQCIDVISDEDDLQITISGLEDKQRKMKQRIQDVIDEAKIYHIEIGDITNIQETNKAVMLVCKDEIFENPNISIQGHDGLMFEPMKYDIVLFIIPPLDKGSSKVVINDTLKKILTSCEIDGIIPFFFISKSSKENEKDQPDVKEIFSLNGTREWEINNIGKTNQEQMYINVIR